MQTMTLYQMKKLDISKLNRNELKELGNVKINPNDNDDVRKKDYINQIKNPYCYKVGTVAVKASFPEDGETLENLFIDVVRKHRANVLKKQK